jgi:hypothetical protein
METFLGVPLLVWAPVCIGVGLLWMYIRPGVGSQQIDGVQGWMLRWGHALVWFLFATAALVGSTPLPRATSIAKGIALCSLITYIGYLVSLKKPSVD